MVILDTSIIIDHLRKPADDSLLIKLMRTSKGGRFGVSAITVQELYAGSSTKDESKEHHLLSVLALFEILPYTTDIAKQAGMIARDLQIPIEFADAAIAATAISNLGKLCTLNEKHFRSIPGLELATP